MVVIVLMLVSFVLVGFMIIAVFVTIQRESVRARIAKGASAELVPAFNFVSLAPLEARIDARVSTTYVKTLSRVLVSDYAESPEIRRIVDELLPPRNDYRRDRRPPSP